MKKTLKAVIPVRSGSQRVKNKNIRAFGNSSLLEIKIKQLKEISLIDEIIVNSDSDEMLNLAEKMQVTPYRRDSYYASNTVSANDLYYNIASTTKADTILYIHATNPLLKTKTIIDIIQKYYNLDSNYDSISTVSLIKEFLWKDNKAINYNVNDKPRSQDLPEIYALNHAVNILPRKLMLERKDLMGYKPLFFELDKYEAIDIDNEIDFEIAEFLYNKYRLNYEK